MLSFFISLFAFMSGVYVFSSKRKHLMLVLLSLEYIVISLFLMIVLYLLCFNNELYFVIIFMVMSVCEGVLGLSILVSMIRSHGNDFFNSFSFSLC
uniref:NADH dehydrogenase subunit 4L n=1 Tax=Phytomastax pentaspinula TaxID=3034359 RepID=UPI0024117C2D|nr:NADH dehydrogenase subunit 4L [Phytomastax pentaspinula]WEL32815.1 NADH dehydrogenase subunit 4L [Phytomastax pentaspinula]